jgi:hypothetical protein
LTATVKWIGSAIWDDLRAMDESRAEVRELPRPSGGPVDGLFTFFRQSGPPRGSGRQLLVVTRRVDGMHIIRAAPPP